MAAPECASYIRRAVQAMGKEFAARQVGETCILTTPYTLANDDRVEVAIRSKGDEAELSDRGMALGYLFLQGLNLSGRSRQELMLRSQLNRFGVEAREGRLVVTCPTDEIEDGMQRLTEAAVAVSLLAYTGRSHGAYDFKSEVAEWLQEQEVRFRPDVHVAGASGQLYTIPFIVRESSETDAYISPLHADTKGWAQNLANRVLVQFVDIKKRQPKGFEFVALVDDRDAEDVWSSPITLMETHLDRVTIWSDREDLAEALT